MLLIDYCEIIGVSSNLQLGLDLFRGSCDYLVLSTINNIIINLWVFFFNLVSFIFGDFFNSGSECISFFLNVYALRLLTFTFIPQQKNEYLHSICSTY